jgi:hypothetical protein
VRSFTRTVTATASVPTVPIAANHVAVRLAQSTARSLAVPYSRPRGGRLEGTGLVGRRHRHQRGLRRGVAGRVRVCHDGGAGLGVSSVLRAGRAHGSGRADRRAGRCRVSTGSFRQYRQWQRDQLRKPDITIWFGFIRDDAWTSPLVEPVSVEGLTLRLQVTIHNGGDAPVKSGRPRSDPKMTCVAATLIDEVFDCPVRTRRGIWTIGRVRSP